MFAFGSGVLLGQRTDVANSTPINFGLVQEVNLDVSFSNKTLFGQYQFPVAVGRGTAKVTGKAKVARISGLVFANLFFGVSVSAGQLATSYGESGTVPTGGGVITVANSTSWVDDYGVIYSTTGLPLTRVGSNPAIGQYSVSNGVYTFAAADATKQMLLSYTYTVTSTGTQFTVPNQLLGVQPTFQAQLYTNYNNQLMNVKIMNAVSNKLALQTKLEDFTIPELDFDVFANAAGNIFQFSFSEAS